MKRFLTMAMLITVTFIFCSNVHATHRTWNRSKVTQGTGFYLGVTGGLNILNDSSLDQGAPVTLDIEYSSGLAFSGGLGYDFGMVRLDAEFTYRDNDIDLIGLPAEGSTSTLSYMLNGYFDIPTTMAIKPYLGGGIGFATVSINDANVPGVTPVADDSASVLAYQFSAGIGYDVSHSVTLSLGYRFFATEDPEMNDAFGAPFTTQNQSHEFNIGIRFLFN